MTDHICCTASEEKLANPAEIENLIQCEADEDRSLIRGTALGFIVGFVLGVAQLAYIGHGIWAIWGVSMLPLLSGFGWSLVGLIVGCSGMLVSRKVPERSAHQFEKNFEEAKLKREKLSSASL
jgi:hypothetical protein